MEDHEGKCSPATGASNPEPEGANSPFSPELLRLAQSYINHGAGRNGARPIRVRKPDKQEYLRVHPSDDYWLETKLLELKSEKLFFLVDPSLWSELSTEISNKALCLCLNRQGELFLWPYAYLMTGGDLMTGAIQPWMAPRGAVRSGSGLRLIWGWQFMRYARPRGICLVPNGPATALKKYWKLPLRIAMSLA